MIISIRKLNFQKKKKRRKLSSIKQQQITDVEDNRHRSTHSIVSNRYLWIRTALIHRSLHQVIEYIVTNGL